MAAKRRMGHEEGVQDSYLEGERRMEREEGA